MRYAGIITAAGLSSRMRDFKPLMTVGDRTMLADIVSNYRFIGAEEIVAVGGYKGDLLKKNTEILGISFAENPDYADTGMFESFCIGVKALKDDYDYVLVSPCDVPVISKDTLRKLSEAEGDVIRPVCNGRGGHPLILSRKAAEKIAGYTGENGIQGAVRNLGFEVNSVEVDDIGILMDADTPEDFKALRKLRMEHNSGGSLWPDISVTIAKADTVLTPRTAQFLEMIDHTGSIQSASACLHMSYTTGWKLLNSVEAELGYPLIERKSGGEKGGGSRLTEKGKRLLKAYSDYLEDIRNYSIKSFEEHFGDLE
jgi:molybdate transport repressor ModE-like protein